MSGAHAGSGEEGWDNKTMVVVMEEEVPQRGVGLHMKRQQTKLRNAPAGSG